MRYQRGRHDRRGYLIASCELSGEAEYTITWKIPLQGDVKSNFAGTIGSSMSERVDPGFITVGLHEDPSKMVIHTYDIAGKPAQRPFHIAAFRDQ